MNPLIVLSGKATLMFSSLKILFLWELPEEFTGTGSHDLEPTGPCACLRNTRRGESSSSFGAFLHIYLYILFFCILALLGPILENSRHAPDDAFQTTCSLQGWDSATSLQFLLLTLIPIDFSQLYTLLAVRLDVKHSSP